MKHCECQNKAYYDLPEGFKNCSLRTRENVAWDYQKKQKGLKAIAQDVIALPIACVGLSLCGGPCEGCTANTDIKP